MDDANALPAGTRLGRFTVLREIGRGGMAKVYEARDPDLDRNVAIKLLGQPGAGRDAAQRFLTESRIAGRLDHPGIVAVHELGCDAEGRLFLVMRRVEGVSLRAALDAVDRGQQVGQWTRTRMLRAVIQVCDAVAYAHGCGVVHRDLKPENVMLGDAGDVQVVDWGLARSFDADGQLKEAVGTPGYMAPELARDGRAGPTADVFALGATLAEVATGAPTFSARDPVDRVAQAFSGAANLPSDDEDLREICRRAIQPDPSRRFRDAAAMGEALHAWESGEDRRRRADERAAEGWSLLGEYREIARELEAEVALVGELGRSVVPGAPLDDPSKKRLNRLLDRVEDIRERGAVAFAATLARCESAVAIDPKNRAARSVLADAYWLRMMEADTRGDAIEGDLLARRVGVYDDGKYRAVLQGISELTLATEPQGALVIAQRIERRGVVWSSGPPRTLGRTPLERLPLEHGSWLLTLRYPGRRDTRYPVFVDRSGPWEPAAAVPLLAEEDVGPGWIYVPGGPFLRGGDPHTNVPRARERVEVAGFLARELPVTVGEYCEFLNHLHATDPASARKRAPRRGADVAVWPRPDEAAPWAPPAADIDGDAWSADWPIFGIDWADASAFASWADARLPRDDEWEKAARGVDGRTYPWGNRFDASLCCNLDSHSGKPTVTGVGAWHGDASIYGVRDIAGSMRTWCSEADFLGRQDLRPVRGGAWSGGAQLGRCANRYGQRALSTTTSIGFRLFRDLPFHRR